MQGYERANSRALELWSSVYQSALLLALTDTFSSKAFFKVSLLSDFMHASQAQEGGQEFLANPKQAQLWHGLRQDSGDPFVFAPQAKDVYAQLGIDHRQKTIIYSDALTVDKVLKLKDQCDGLGFKCILFYSLI